MMRRCIDNTLNCAFDFLISGLKTLTMVNIIIIVVVIIMLSDLN